MSIAIVCDSACDIPPDLLKKSGINEVPVIVTFGDESYKENIDITGDEFYKRLTETKELPTTSQPTVGDFEKVYKNLLSKHTEILSIHISAKVSGTYNSAVQAAEKISKDKIKVVDSKNVSMGTGLVVLAVAQELNNKKSSSMSDLIKLTEQLSAKSKILVACETVDYLKRGGRISAGAAFFGGLLNVKPVIGNKDGEVIALARPRSMIKALAYVRNEAERHTNHQGMAVIQTTESFDARALYNSLSDNAALLPAVSASKDNDKKSKDKDKGKGKDKGKDKGKGKGKDKASKENMYVGEVIKAQFGPAVGTHAGPGAVGVAFIGDPPSKK